MHAAGTLHPSMVKLIGYFLAYFFVLHLIACIFHDVCRMQRTRRRPALRPREQPDARDRARSARTPSYRKNPSHTLDA